MADPKFKEFNPKLIPWQWDATKYIRDFNYQTGALEVFYSGGVGSAKTIDHVHELILNCIEQPGSKWLMVRRTLKDLKRTSWKKMIKHADDVWDLVKEYNKSEMRLTFINDSEILGDSYDDEDETKFQSLDLSGLDIEEANEMPLAIYNALKLRVGRAGVPINRIQARCNPDSPSHWLYNYFIEDVNHPNKKVFYSLTHQNPFLPSWYVENLKRDLDPKMARRKLYGEWIEINDEMVYHAYDSNHNFVKMDYELKPNYPIILSFDFNIGHGKPMSSIASQVINDQHHFFAEQILSGARTPEVVEAWLSSGIFKPGMTVKIRGDASGKARDTRSIVSDYDIIKRAFSNFGLIVLMEVPRENPPVRTRHNIVNAYCLNEAGQRRLFVYNKCKVAHDGMRLTALKQNGNYVEDDSKHFQHVTTAIGYSVVYEHNNKGSMEVSSSRR